MSYTKSMAILSTSYDQSSSKVVKQSTHFVGRVVRIQEVTETRNHSDTMDYSDFRSTKCTYALVYLGRHGVAPSNHTGRMTTGTEPYSCNPPRELTVGERFAWVDCTGLFVWRGSPALKPEVDSFDMQLLWGGPEMLSDLEAWDAHQDVLRNKATEERAAAAAMAEAQRQATLAKVAKKEAKEAALKVAAEKLLARIPAKGTTVTVDGFTGKVFWTGVSKYRGTYNARAGVKDSRGEVAWIDASKF